MSSINNPSGGGGGGHQVLAIQVDFGMLTNAEETVTSPTTVTGQAWVTSSSVVTVVLSQTQTGDNTLEEAIIQEIQGVVDNLVPGVGFDVIGVAAGGTRGTVAFDCFSIS